MEVYAVNYGNAKFYRFQGNTAVIPSPASKSMPSIHSKDLPDFFAKYTKECLKSRLMLDVVLVAFTRFYNQENIRLCVGLGLT